MNNDSLLIYNIGEGATAFSTTRHGGVSKGNYASLNVNAYCGDNADDVEANRQALCEYLGIERCKLVMPHQVHGTEVRQIAKDFLALPDPVRQMILEDVDAVMTDVEGVCIGVSTADCIPILLYEPQHKVACAVHAGWRGTAKRIVEKAIGAMVLTYKINPVNLQAAIGPGISLASFEVGDEVYNQFSEAGFPMEEIAVRQRAFNPEYASQEKWHINLPLCNRLQMEGMGVKPENINDSAIDTFTHADDYFSARRLGVNSGRIFSGIIIR